MSEQNQMRSVVTVLLVMGLVIAAIASLFVMNTEEGAPVSDRVGGDFVLQSSSGPVSLEQFRGKAVLLFFGYTHCPDVCPATMSNIAEAISLLNDSERKKVQSLFITVDPARDSIEHLAEYVGFFHSKTIGLSGSADEIKRVAEMYSVEYFRDGEKGGGDRYLVSHSSYLFLINPEGEVSDMMSEHTAPEDIAKALRQYVSR